MADSRAELLYTSSANDSDGFGSRPLGCCDLETRRRHRCRSVLVKKSELIQNLLKANKHEFGMKPGRPATIARYFAVTSGGGGRFRCFSHSSPGFCFLVVFGRVSRAGMKTCRPPSGVMRV